MTMHKINEHGQVVPYTGGRPATDTRAWRDATDLELAQRDEIVELEKRVKKIEDDNAKLLSALDGMMHVHEHNLSGDAACPFVIDAYEILLPNK